MARGDQLGRQWIIIQRLLTARDGVAVRELAAALDCHRRTVYRDLEALQVAGFPLYTDETDAGTRWKMLDTGRRQMPLPLDLSELMALFFSRRVLASAQGGLFSTAVESMFEKVKSLLPPDTHALLEQFGSRIAVRESTPAPGERSASIIAAVNAALDAGRCLDVVYRGRLRSGATRRTVSPYKLWFTDGVFYLVGYCHLRADVRLFALDRIAEVTTTDSPISIPPDADVESPMTSGLGAYSGVPETVRIQFSPPAADYIADRVWHPSQRITRRNNGPMVFEAEVAVNEELVGFVLRWGAAAEVLAPDHFRHRVRNALAAALKAY
jgi:predicted DNA-binding transcriptional regulator YafY